MRYFPALTGIRGVAAFWVFLFHAFPGTTGNAFITHGYLGVDLFFILSGFIISHIHAADFAQGVTWTAFRRFMVLRIARIYPLHLLTLLAMLVVVLAVPAFSQAYSPAAFSALNFVANIFLIHNWLIPILPQDLRGPGWSWNCPSWSLSAEWLLYLLFPAIAMVLRRFKRTSHCLALGLASLACYMVLEIMEVNLAGLPRAFAEFFAGCTLCFALNHREQDWAHWAGLSWLALALLALSATGNGLQVLAPLSCFLLIPAIAYGESRITAVFASRFCQQLGEISLALYLIHWPILQFQQHLLAVDWNASPLMAAMHWLFLAAIVGLAFPVHRWFELPMRAHCRRWLTGQAGQPARPPARHPGISPS